MPRQGWTAKALPLMLIALWGLPALVSLTGCQQEIKVSDHNLLQIEYRELASLLASDDKQRIVLVDARKANQFDQGHIPRAVNIFLPDIAAGDARLGKASHIIVYANGWGDPISSAAGKRLMALGYKNVLNFRGGIEAWRAEGRLLAVNRQPQGPDQSP